ncbi:hypothetical protein ACT691_17445 [Vibrio metschnikovii]
MEGSGPNIARQTSSHAHQATFLNHAKQLAVCGRFQAQDECLFL